MKFQKEKVARILVIKLRAIGDTVLSLPAVHELKRGFSGAAITCLVPAAAAGVLAHDPAVSEVIPYRREWFKGLAHHLAVFQGLQSRRFDLAVCLHASFRTGLLGWMSGARWRSVRNHSGPDWFGNLRSREVKRAKSIIQREFDGLRALGLDPVREKPVMSLSAAARGQAAAFWKKNHLSNKKVVALLPGAGKAEKRWPTERFRMLATALSRRKFTPLWITAPGETAPGQGVTSASFGDLQVLGAVLARCGSVIGNDSGPRHIAAACGARTLTLFGPEGLEEWHPYRREEGHWALKPPSGRITDLTAEAVEKEALRWLL